MRTREQSINASKFYIRSLSLYDTALRERKMISEDNEFFDDEFRVSINHAGLALEFIFKALGQKLNENGDTVSNHSWVDIANNDILPYLKDISLYRKFYEIIDRINQSNLSGFLTHLSVYNDSNSTPDSKLAQFEDYFKNLNLNTYDEILSLYEDTLKFYKERAQISLNTDFLTKGENLLKENNDLNLLNEHNYKEKLINLEDGINYLLKFLCIANNQEPKNDILMNLMYCSQEYHEVNDLEFGLRHIVYLTDMFEDGINFETLISDSKFKYCVYCCDSLLNFCNRIVGNF